MKPILFSLGHFHLYSFGLMVALGVMISIFLMERRAARFGFPSEKMVLDFIFVAVVAGFVGARTDYVLQNLGYYSSHLLEVFAVWEGGLIFYGGVVGAFLALFVFCGVKKISFVKTLDFLLPFVALAHAFGRVGCFLNGCCGGKVCDFPWAVRFPDTLTSVHPTQLYEVALDLLLFAGLSFVYTRNQKVSMSSPNEFVGDLDSRLKHAGMTTEGNQKPSIPEKPGQTAVLYFIGYGMIRFVMEFYRAGNPYWGPLTINQWFSLVLIVLPVFFYVNRNRHMKGKLNDRS